MSKDNYGVKDIQTLEGIEAIRLRPGIGPEWKIVFYQFL